MHRGDTLSLTLTRMTVPLGPGGSPQRCRLTKAHVQPENEIWSPDIEISGSASGVLGPAPSVPPRNGSEMQVLRPQPRPPEPRTAAPPGNSDAASVSGDVTTLGTVAVRCSALDSASPGRREPACGPHLSDTAPAVRRRRGHF